MKSQPTYRGTSLVEMVMLLTIVSVVLVLTLQLLRRTISIQQACVREVADLRIRDALGQRLRLDVACAKQATIDEQQQLRLIRAGGEVVVYRMAEAGWIYREVQRVNEVVARDRWQLTGVARWSLQLDSRSASDPTQDMVRIEFASATTHSLPRLRILARVDSSRAFLVHEAAGTAP